MAGLNREGGRRKRRDGKEMKIRGKGWKRRKKKT